MSGRINWITVILAVIVQQFIGFVWYGLLLQQEYMAAVGLTDATVDEANMPVAFALAIFGSALVAVLLSLILSGMDEWGLGNGLKWGLLLWLLLALPILASLNMWAQRGWKLTAIDGAEALVLLLAAGAIVGLRRPKNSGAR
jgi:hypothetical protein